MSEEPILSIRAKVLELRKKHVDAIIAENRKWGEWDKLETEWYIKETRPWWDKILDLFR